MYRPICGIPVTYVKLFHLIFIKVCGKTRFARKTVCSKFHAKRQFWGCNVTQKVFSILHELFQRWRRSIGLAQF